MFFELPCIIHIPFESKPYSSQQKYQPNGYKKFISVFI